MPARDDVLQQRRAEHGGRAVDLARVQPQAAASHDLVELARDRVPHAVALVVELAAQVEAEPRVAGHDVDRPGEGLEPADGADDVVLGAQSRSTASAASLAPSERVAAAVVGRAAGVPGLALDDELEAPRRAIDDDDRERFAAPSSSGPCSMCASR